MIRRRWPLACVVVAFAAAPALAQDQIESYKPDFFESARPATAMDMINRLPGFSFDGGSGSRGFSGNAGNVLINGRRPASKSDSLSSALSRIVAGDVERIDVIQGGAPGIDMQGKAIIANVIRKDEPSTSIVATASTYYFNTGRAIPAGQIQYSRTEGDRSYEFAVKRDANFNDDMGQAGIIKIDATGHAAQTAETRRGSGGTIGVNGAIALPLAGGDFSVNATATDHQFSNGTLYDYAAGPEEYTSTNRDQNGEVGANYQVGLGDGVLDLIALQRRGHKVSSQILEEDGAEARFSSLRDSGESIARFSLRYPLTNSVAVEGGAEAAYNYLEGRSVLSQNGSEVEVPSSNVEVNESRGEAYGQVSWQVRDDLVLDAGVRAEYSTISQSSVAGDAGSSRSFFYPKPRTSLSWTVNDDSLVRLRAEKQLGQLNFGDFISSASLTQGNVTAGNPELQPDQRWQYELAYERRFWDRGAVTVSLLHQAIDNIIDNKPLVTPEGTFDVRGNIGSGTAERLSVDTTIPTDGFGIPGGLLNLEADWRQSALTDPVTGLTRRFSGEDASSYEASFSQDLEAWKSTWSISYNHGWDHMGYRLGQIDHNQGAPSVHASWNYRPSAEFNLTFSVNNLITAGRSRDSRYFAGPRDIAALARREIETTYNRPRFFVSLRKTFD